MRSDSELEDFFEDESDPDSEDDVPKDRFFVDGLGLKTRFDPKAPHNFFRLQTTRVLLTWSGLPNGKLGKLRAFIQLVRRLPSFEQYIICDEKHDNPANADHADHIHMVIVFSKKIDTRDPRMFSLKDVDGNWHPAFIQTIGATKMDLVRAIIYCQKDGKYWQHVTLDLPTSGAATTKPAAWAEDLKLCESVPTAMKLLLDKYPEKFMRSASTIKQNLIEMFAMTTKTEVKYGLGSYDHECLDLEKAVLLTGPSGCGKTGFAKAHFKNPLVHNMCST